VERGFSHELSQDLSQIPLESMTPTQMKKHFGRQALEMMGALWQHQSKIAEQARFMTKVWHVRS
jgi:DNA-binding winged helix-turn-helix (wHTH) protein